MLLRLALAAGVVCALVKGGKFALSIFLAALWHRSGRMRRLIGMLFIAGAMAGSAWVLNELIAMHLADHGTVAAGIETKNTEIEILIRNQQSAKGSRCPRQRTGHPANEGRSQSTRSARSRICTSRVGHQTDSRQFRCINCQRLGSMPERAILHSDTSGIGVSQKRRTSSV